MIQRLARQLGKEERDLHVLETVLEHQPIEPDAVARRIDVDEHKVRHSIRMLEDDGLVESSAEGVVTASDVEERLERLNAEIDGLIEMVVALKRIDL